MTRRAATGVVIAFATTGFLAAQLDEIPPGLRAVGVLPLVLVLPGFALLEAISPLNLSLTERALLSITLSMAIAIMGGLGLHFTSVGLNAESWSVLLAGTTLALWAVALVRLYGRAEAPAPAPWRRPSYRTGVIAGLATVITIGSLVLARTPLPANHVDGYTALWIEPPNASGTVRIAVESAELAAMRYMLQVRHSGDVVATRTITLSPGERWEWQLRFAVDSARSSLLEANLFRIGDASPYRSVHLAPSTNSNFSEITANAS